MARTKKQQEPVQTKEDKVRTFSYALTTFQKSMDEYKESIKTVQMCVNRKRVVETNDQGLSKEVKQQTLEHLDKYEKEYQAKADAQINQAIAMLDSIKKSLE